MRIGICVPRFHPYLSFGSSSANIFVMQDANLYRTCTRRYSIDLCLLRSFICSFFHADCIEKKLHVVQEQAVLLTFTSRNKYEEDISYSIDTLLIPTDPDETALNEGISMSDFPSFQPARLCSLCKQLKMCIILKTNQSIKLSY